MSNALIIDIRRPSPKCFSRSSSETRATIWNLYWCSLYTFLSYCHGLGTPIGYDWFKDVWDYVVNPELLDSDIQKLTNGNMRLWDAIEKDNAQEVASLCVSSLASPLNYPLQEECKNMIEEKTKKYTVCTGLITNFGTIRRLPFEIRNPTSSCYHLSQMAKELQDVYAIVHDFYMNRTDQDPISPNNIDGRENYEEMIYDSGLIYYIDAYFKGVPLETLTIDTSDI